MKMSFIQLFLVVLFITFSLASNSELHFSDLGGEIVIGKEKLQAYTNNLDEEGTMELRLVLEDDHEYNLSSMVCRVGKGQFNWTPPKNIPDGTKGVFKYTVKVDGEEFSGTSDKMKFVSSSSSSSKSSSESTSTSSSEKSDVTQTAPSEASVVSPDKIIINNSSPTNIQNGNDTVADNGQQQNNNVQQSLGNNNGQAGQNNDNNKVDGVNSPPNEGNNKYLIYIGGGSGIVVVALTGLFIFYRVKSRRSLSEYEFDSRPYNNTSMDISQMPNLLNGNLASVNILGSPSFNDTSKGSQYGLYNNNNNPKSYHVPNIESGGSGLLLSPDLSNMTSNFYNTSQKEKDKSKRNTYEMISPYDPRETSYQNFNGNFDESLVLDNNGIINLNSSSNMNLNVDINSKLPKSENYCANPRSGSLPRNRVPNELAVPLMNEGGDEEENKKNYRSSILSYISSNRGSYYGDNADHSISHILLNHVCTVAYASQPENEDELYLKVGDKVKILEVYDDGWACALQISTGLEGMIPLNCTAEYYQ
ncbi:hypothetical protein LY90DRAFT_508956 [Neocallimastix californiae]|jgi:hypothetical protein|uniref:SH3 domain-containing protein n=1 Tax=Neocallimastix californiae TaxID=1754190 RepID=A0A1Y2CLR8_9FUNG|nr:hypothetical protein LY90DRAFT_508956 [Neocallimastix californiae]|eukprot:ORY47968.1 hypothetical protein LY90DRAFT_508956 [Neocallimastix californiae]